MASADHFLLLNRLERRLVPAGALWGESSTPPSSLKSRPEERLRWRTSAWHRAWKVKTRRWSSSRSSCTRKGARKSSRRREKKRAWERTSAWKDAFLEVANIKTSCFNGLTTTKQEVFLFHPIPKLRDDSCLWRISESNR